MGDETTGAVGTTIGPHQPAHLPLEAPPTPGLQIQGGYRWQDHD